MSCVLSLTVRLIHTGDRRRQSRWEKKRPLQGVGPVMLSPAG
jgi:hypothetical protein